MTIHNFTPLKFYTAKVCPYAHRVSITLHELGLIDNIIPGVHANGQLELVEIDLKNKPEWYTRDINPRGKVPSLQITTANGDKNILVESNLITEFLLQSKGHPMVLMTADNALSRYRAGLVIDTFSNQVIPTYYALLREKDTSKQPEAATKLLDGINSVQSLLSRQGPYALGADFSIADILIAPFIARFPVVEHFRGFKIPNNNEYDRFNQWTNALLQRPSVKLTRAEMDYLFNAYKAYAE